MPIFVICFAALWVCLRGWKDSHVDMELGLLNIEQVVVGEEMMTSAIETIKQEPVTAPPLQPCKHTFNLVHFTHLTVLNDEKYFMLMITA